MDSVVSGYVRTQVGDWDDEDISVARFKAFNGQRSDWENRYLFWKDLILKVARHLGTFIISPSQVKNNWFNRGGLTPLCLDDVLFGHLAKLLTYNPIYYILEVGSWGQSPSFQLMRTTENKDLANPTSGRISQLFGKAIRWVSRPTPSELTLEDHLILLPVLKDKANEVVEHLSDSHWTSSCVITMKKLHEICGGSDEAFSILSYLSGCGKAKYLTANKKKFIEGVKISLCSTSCTMSGLDSYVLHLIWTVEKLQQQLDVIDQRYEMSRKLALASLSSENKKVALRHMRELKLVSESREKCTALLNRVEEVLNVIGDAESTKKVSEVMLSGAKAMKENQIDAEEIQLCLQELDESVDTQRHIEDTLGSSAPCSAAEDEDIEEEFRKLRLEVGDGEKKTEPGKPDAAEAAESLSDALSNLTIGSVAVDDSRIQNLDAKRNLHLEAA